MSVKEKELWALIYGREQFIKGPSCLEIGLFKVHCFCTKNLDQLDQLLECLDCQQKFNWHQKKDRCTHGKTKLIWIGKKLKSFASSSERVFYEDNNQYSLEACIWIQGVSVWLGNILIMHSVVTMVRNTLSWTKKKSLLMVTSQRVRKSISSTAAGGTGLLVF